MKIATDLEQSKKLIEILPIESADMYYHYDNDLAELESIPTIREEDDHFILFPIDVRCWSFAALFSVLPIIGKDKDTANPFIAKTPAGEYYVVYATLYKEIDSSGIYSNPVDACVEMILKLKEKNQI